MSKAEDYAAEMSDDPYLNQGRKRDSKVSVITVIADDEKLSQRQKRIMMELYRVFTGGTPGMGDDSSGPQNRSESPSEAASAEVQQIISRQTVRRLMRPEDQIGNF